MKQYTNPSLRKLAGELKQKKKQFEDVKKNWNMLIRNYLTKNMGVTLTEGDNRWQINVSIADAPDESFMELIENNFPDLDFEEYFLLNKFIQNSEQSEKYFTDSKASHNLKMANEYAKYRLKDFDILSISGRVFDFLEPSNPDVFGRYYIRTSEVQLYIFPIVLFTQLHGLDLESFIVMVLTHELTHAYNHIGRDKDGEYWQSFAETDDNLAEGLAQYYTYNFLRTYQHKKYELVKTFERTLEFQPNPYKVFKGWDASMEQVYRAFIEVRRNDRNFYPDFLSALANAKGRIGSGTRGFFDNELMF